MRLPWNKFDFHHFCIDGMFAGVKRFDPHTFIAFIDKIAVGKSDAAYILVRFSHIGNYDAYIADRHFGHFDLFNLHKPGIQVPRTG